ncbi:hypothetical protein SPRA44_610023 [Serratia proteamaculans]|nr:hypothetical protein SPRA44_610023 [Serratia proteamaculans]
MVLGCLLRIPSVVAVEVLDARLYLHVYTVVPLALSFP